MPYVLVYGGRDALAQWTICVSGVKASEEEHLRRFGYDADRSTNLTLMYRQHPSVILNALEIFGYKVVTSASSADKRIEYMWTMRKEFPEPEPDPETEPEDGPVTASSEI